MQYNSLHNYIYAVGKLFTFEDTVSYQNKPWTIKSELSPRPFGDDTKDRVTSYPRGYLKVASIYEQVNNALVSRGVYEIDAETRTARTRPKVIPTDIKFNYHLYSQNVNSHYLTYNKITGLFNHYQDGYWAKLTIDNEDYSVRVKLEKTIHRDGELLHLILPFTIVADVISEETEFQPYIEQFMFVIGIREPAAVELNDAVEDTNPNSVICSPNTRTYIGG